MLAKTAMLKSLMLFSMFFISMAGFSQSTIKGKVLDADSKPVSGVTIKVKNAKQSVITSDDGSYSITVPAAGKQLEISSIGFEERTIEIGGRMSIDIVLTKQVSNLNEVVVIGYGSQKRKDLSGAISSVSAATIEKVPVTSVDQALQGRAAGVQVTNNDGAPGGNLNIMIRGVGSPASDGNGPLFVVDGYPTNGGINNINPNDVATIDVLKDASATAIYGVRAANGVVIITTKKGKKGSSQVSFDAYTAFQSKPKQYKLLNAQQWATLANEVADADVTNNFNELPIWRTPSALTSVDWQNALYRNALTQNYSLGIRGGSDKVQTSTSVGYYDQKGVVLGSYFKRLSLGLNIDAQPVKWLKSSTSAKYSYQNANNPFGTGSLIQAAQLPPTLDSGNRLTNQIKDANGNYGFYNPINTYVSKFGNPIYNIETNEYKNITNFLLVSSSLELTLTEGLRLKTNAGVNVSQYAGTYYQPQDLRISDQYNLGGATQNALYSQRTRNTYEWVWENTIAYDRKFGSHGISFVGGVSAQKNVLTMTGASGIPPNSVIRDLRQLRNLQFDPGGNGERVYTLASQFARLTYSYSDRYIITGTVRRDGSSKFGANNQYGTFPTGAIAWKLKQESFLKDANWIADLKLRASYGKVGNERPIDVFKYEALYSSGAGAANSGNLGYPFGNVFQGGIAATQPDNPNLRWETDYQTNIGLDATFLKGELTLTVDWFNRRSKDFLLSLPAPAQSGYSTLTQNVGDMSNKGIEIALNYNHAASKDLTYGAMLTFTSYKNKLISLNSSTKTLDNPGAALAGIGWDNYTRTTVGGSVGEFFGYQSLGIFQTQAQIDALNAASVAKNPDFPNYQKAGNLPGDRYFADINGDGHVNADDRISLGSPIPKFFAGLNLDVTYKAWDVNAYFYGVYGNKIVNYVKSSLESFQNRSFVGVQNVSLEYFENRWTPSNPSNVYGRATYNDDAIGSNVPSSAWIENGSFLRLKNLTVGYSIPVKAVSKLAISKLRFYVSTQNLFTMTKYTGPDPEIGMLNGNPLLSGIDNGIYPGSKFYTVGLNVTF